MTAVRTPKATRLTPAGRGAIAVIAVAGAPPEASGGLRSFRPANRRSWNDQPLLRLLYGQWGAEPSEDVVVCRIDQDRFEIHCHGGDAAVQRILADLNHCGIDIVRPEDWPFIDDVLAFELQETLLQAITARAADLLNEQAMGCLKAAFEELGDGSVTDAARAQAMLQWAEFGLHLTQPWQVVVTGRPNVGKSSLINALLGFERAIVAEQPGTTRDVVTAITAFDGWPVQLSDTAGLRETDSELEAAGIERARTALETADLRVIVLDISEPTDADRQLLAEWPDSLVVAHKSDRPDLWGHALPADALRVSSRTRAGLPELQRELVRRLVPNVPPPGTPIPVTPRQVALLERIANSESLTSRCPS